MRNSTSTPPGSGSRFAGSCPAPTVTTNPTTEMTLTERRDAMMDLTMKARTDPAEFVLQALRTAGTELATVHRELQHHLSTHRLALVELPRDHGKTTQVCLRILWELGQNPDLRVKVVCASEAVAADRSRFLRSSIDANPTVRRVFPHLRRARPWRAQAFTVRRAAGILGPTVMAFGLGAASTGTRADLLICDDVVDVRAIHSKAQRDRAADDFTNNLLNLLEPDGKFWGLSTPWHADDLNARLKRNPAYALFRRAVGPGLEPVWPEHWPREALERRKGEIGSAAFARGYGLTPVAEEELVIRPEWVKTWAERPERFDRVILSIDPAVSAKATADASAAVVLGKAGNVVYSLMAEARRVAAPTLVEWIDALDAAWKPNEIVFESNGAFDAVRELLVRHARFGPKVVGVKQSRSKLARFAALGVVVQNGAFLIPSDGSQAALWEEMTSFPFGEHDDLLDAAATGVSHVLSMRPEPRVWLM